MSNKAQQDFQSINTLLMKVLWVAKHYAIKYEVAKQFSLQTASWESVNELVMLQTRLSQQFLDKVMECLKKCVQARARMPELSVTFPEFSCAADSLMELAKQLEMMAAEDPSLKEGIPVESLATHQRFQDLADILARG